MLPKREKIKSGQEIRQISRDRQKTVKTPLLKIVAKAKAESTPRIVISCGKVVAKACKRNRTRRIIEAIYLKKWRKINKKYDLVIQIRHKKAENEIDEALGKIFVK